QIPSATPVPDDLKRGLRAALRAAEPLAIQCFCAKEWGLDPGESGVETASYLSLACLTLSRHRVGGLIWTFLHAPQPKKKFISQDFVNAMCNECEAELEFFHAGDGIVEYQHADPKRVRPDPEQPEPKPPKVPSFSSSKRKNHPWGPVADA